MSMGWNTQRSFHSGDKTLAEIEGQTTIGWKGEERIFRNRDLVNP